MLLHALILAAAVAASPAPYRLPYGAPEISSVHAEAVDAYGNLETKVDFSPPDRFRVVSFQYGAPLEMFLDRKTAFFVTQGRWAKSNTNAITASLAMMFALPFGQDLFLSLGDFGAPQQHWRLVGTEDAGGVAEQVYESETRRVWVLPTRLLARAQEFKGHRVTYDMKFDYRQAAAVTAPRDGDPAPAIGGPQISKLTAGVQAEADIFVGTFDGISRFTPQSNEPEIFGQAAEGAALIHPSIMATVDGRILVASSHVRPATPVSDVVISELRDGRLKPVRTIPTPHEDDASVFFDRGGDLYVQSMAAFDVYNDVGAAARHVHISRMLRASKAYLQPGATVDDMGHRFFRSKRNVWMYSSSGGTPVQFPVPKAVEALDNPNGIHLATRGDRLFVLADRYSDLAHSELYEYSIRVHRLVRHVRLAPFARDLAVSADGTVFIIHGSYGCDSEDSGITQISGPLLQKHSERNEHIRDPQAVAVDTKGLLYVLEGPCGAEPANIDVYQPLESVSFRVIPVASLSNPGFAVSERKIAR